MSQVLGLHRGLVPGEEQRDPDDQARDLAPHQHAEDRARAARQPAAEVAHAPAEGGEQAEEHHGDRAGGMRMSGIRISSRLPMRRVAAALAALAIAVSLAGPVLAGTAWRT